MTAVDTPAAGRPARTAASVPGFATAAWDLYRAGWTSGFPLPRGKKSPPPCGVTGGGRTVPSGADIAEWIHMAPRGNIGIGMSHRVAVDCDDYEKGGVVKRGAATLSAIEADTGVSFPATFKITSRGDDVSGKYLGLVPDGVELVGALPGVELIQHWHRYAVAPPSINPDSGGSIFEWRADARPDPATPGVRLDRIPRPADPPMLPAELVAALRRDGERGTPLEVSREDWAGFFNGMPRGYDGVVCTAVRRRFRAAVLAARGQTGTSRRRDAAAHAAAAALRRQGHLGVSAALQRLAEVYSTSVADRASEGAAHREFLRMIGRRAVGQILAEPTDPEARERGCLCAEGMAALLIATGDPVEFAEGFG
ncbi:hypothetical protein AD006_28985 (plasmid) [Pseudonocardia sp. EC080610-09]|uniref:bifunctional DNA primase/polymerase n=1 Tax=unclassified Pseudonocardia TaxID=2619320 RepID=UPI0007063AA4|nr:MULTISPECIES: bifunctional DNA primase/polymerase [unclassified Pseudonocardia]ALL79337.1 hypothetical protein AD006_28985 [Pseudonocardia sp. EC080610-09]ALL85308.1 hypothetical protein AD017_29375 [Pseudonocardia sp. EC080619-01]